MLEKVLVILRGIPGCGKSTFAKIIASASNICTADDYHMVDGEYNWKPENVHSAHLWCQSKARGLMKSGVSPVVVANTSTTEKEITPYIEAAKEFDYTVFTIIVENRHDGINTHGVPEETLQKMRNRFNIQL